MKRTLLALIMLAALLVPAKAFAAQAGYSIDQISTELYVETNASIHVIERQTLTFEQDGKGAVWYLLEPENGESIKIASVRAARLNDEGAVDGDWISLQLVDSNPDSQGAKPGDVPDAGLRGADVQPWYSHNLSDGMLRCYFPAEPGTYLVETDFTVANRVSKYRDVSELYWRYAQSDTPVDALDATLRVALPVPSGSEIEPGSTVRAWGHGPSDGTVTIGQDGSIVFHVDVVPCGHYAEAHLLFPAYWLDNVPLNSPSRHTAARRDAAIAEESDWMDVSARASIWDNKVRMMSMPLVAIAALAAIAVAAAFKRTYRTRRWFVRIAATLAIVAILEQAFFREPFTTAILLGVALIIALLALLLPREEVNLE